MKTILVLVMMITLNGFGVTVTDKVLSAIENVESKGKNVIGDLHLPEKSYGSFQIRRQYLSDVSKVYKKEMIEKWGKMLTLNDLLNSREQSKWVVRCYIQHYGASYERRTGNKCTVETFARIHNGGPRGAEKKYKKLYTATTVYKNKVMKCYKA